MPTSPVYDPEETDERLDSSTPQAPSNVPAELLERIPTMSASEREQIRRRYRLKLPFRATIRPKGIQARETEAPVDINPGQSDEPEPTTSGQPAKAENPSQPDDNSPANNHSAPAGPARPGGSVPPAANDPETPPPTRPSQSNGPSQPETPPEENPKQERPDSAKPTPAAQPVYDEEGNVDSQTPGGQKNNKDAPDREELNDAEESAGNSFSKKAGAAGAAAAAAVGAEEESLYKPDQSSKMKSRIWLFNKRRAAFGGGLIGIIVGIVFFFTFTSGPFEIVHIAQLLENAHFSHQINAGDDRMGRLFRFARTGDVGETRLNKLESKYKNRIIGQMEKIGLTPVYDNVTGYLKSFNIDASDPRSPYHGMSNEEIQSTLNEKFGTKVSVNQINGLKGKFNVKAQGFFADPKTNRLMTKETGNSVVTTAIRSRVLGKYGLATWHPLKIVDKKINQSVADAYKKWSKARQDRLKNGANASEVNATGASEEDENGKKTPVVGENTTLSSDKVSSTLKAISASKSLKVTGGLATAVGLVCAVNTVRKNIGDIRYVQVITPMIRMAMDIVASGSQVQAGQDIDGLVTGFVSKSFTSTDSSGKTTSWDQARPFEARAGNSGGVDIDSGTKDLILGGAPSWIAWTANTPIPTLCSGAGQAITGAVSVVLGVFSGGLISTATQAVVGAIGSQYVIDKLSHLLAGEALDVAASGAQWGNYIDYGARLAGNSMAFVFGGVALSPTQEAQLDVQENNIEQANWQSQSIASRLFNRYDDRSAISKLIDNTTPSFKQNISNVGSMLLNFSHSFGSISSLFGAKASAAPQPYDYGFPEYGFSQSDLDNPAVTNPYSNADDVAKMLDASCLKPDKTTDSSCPVIKQANTCFGVNITKGDEGWDVIPDHPVNPNDDAYKHANCTDSSQDWLKVRFFIFDTGEMEGYACDQGDDTSCVNDGMEGSITPVNDSSDSGAPSGTSSGSLPSGPSQQLAQQLLPYIASGKIVCGSAAGNPGYPDNCSDIQNTAKGTPLGGNCQVSALTPHLLGLILGLAQEGWTLGISAMCSDHHSEGDGPYGGHSYGSVADFSIQNGVSGSAAAANEKFVDAAAALLSSTGGSFGQSQCHGDYPVLDSSLFTTFPDQCTHQHIRAAP